MADSTIPVVMAPTAFPGGRFAIVGNPQGAVFGLHMLSRGRP